MVELYPFQQELFERSLSALAPEKARVMLQLPTGAGKTEIAGALLKGLLSVWTKAAWLTHREELAEQTVVRLRKNWSIGAMSLTEGWHTETPAPHIPEGVAVLKAQTVTLNNKQYSGVWRSYSDRDLLVIDEAHHAPASGWERAIEQWPGRVLGLTATPWRLEKNRGFSHLFHTLIQGPQIPELQTLGFLAPSRLFAPPPGARIVGGKTLGSGGDYTPGSIRKANGDVAENAAAEAAYPPIMTTQAVLYWQAAAGNRPTIAYAVSRDHAHNLARGFDKADVSAAVILGSTGRGERKEAIERFRSGDVQVLVNVEVATEGFDLPDASCVMITRPTKSLALYLQMVGRGLRPKVDGADCLILDLANNAEEHGLPETIRLWSLHPRGEQPAGDPPVSYCPECGFTTHPANHECPNCHAPLMKKCGWCGVHRPWSAWSSTGRCPVEHEAVCDRCHDDKHFKLGLPQGNIHCPERDALVALYEATGGPNWANNDNWLTEAPLDQWHGVAVNDVGSVSALDLHRNRLEGELPVELSRLVNLTELDLSGNQFTGGLPNWLGDLTSLTALRLGGQFFSRSGFTGEIPSELANLTNLTELYLGDNQLSGEIPSALGRLTGLTRLFLNRNQLSGEIPWGLGRLVKLTTLDLGDNQLSGEIPPELGDLTGLTRLFLNGNQLSGEIPPELGNLTNLTRLFLNGNQLSGEIPWELGRLVKLTTLDLGDNQLSGEIPPELGDLTGLTRLFLNGNQLSGEIPPELGNLTNLTRLFLNGNQLSGEIPWELGRLVKLTTLELGDSQLGGDVPWALGRLTGLTRLALSRNQLSGEIPPELGNLTNLTELYLGDSQLSGEIPPELGRLINLQVLTLSRNQLSGEIPPELGNLTNLTRLFLNGNQLSGEIPPELGNLTNLTRLFLNGNQLSGEIPPELGDLTGLTSLDLGDNQLSGEIPPELGDLTGLTGLALDGNQLSGEIPPELGNLTNLTRLFLNGNQLSGEIPWELGRLVKLTTLELGDNQLGGDVPWALGRLTGLTRLALSRNQLSGEIPPELGRLANLRALYLSKNQLSGDIPAQLGNLPNLERIFLNGNDELTGCIPKELRTVKENDLAEVGLPFC